MSAHEETFSRRLSEDEQRNSEALEKMRTQKIFAGCDFAQSQALSEMARHARSVYHVLEPEERARLRGRDFDTDRRVFEKILLVVHPLRLLGRQQRDPVEEPVRQDHHRVAQSDRLLFYNDGMSATERVYDYHTLKLCLYSQYNTKSAIMHTHKVIFAWRRVEGERLVTSYRSFKSLVHRYCHVGGPSAWTSCCPSASGSTKCSGPGSVSTTS